KTRRTAGHGVLPPNYRAPVVGATPRGRPAAERRPHGAAPTPATAGHGLIRQESEIHHRGHRVHRDPVLTSARAARRRPSSVPSVSSVVKSSFPDLRTAGHGVLPPISARPLDRVPPQGFVQRTLLGGTALGLGVTVRPPAPRPGTTDTLANG